VTESDSIQFTLPEWDDGFLIATAIWKRCHEVARIHGQLSDKGDFELDDVVVRSGYPVPRTWLQKLLCRPVKRVDFRKQGIGSRLLRLVVSEVKAAGASEIWGSVVPADLQENTYLLDWYRTQKFRVMEPDSRCLPHAVKMVVLDLE
jgi:GNAT superfamily N-acetyltransferase